MSTPTQTLASGVAPYRVTVEQFERMIAADVFPEVVIHNETEGVPVGVDGQERGRLTVADLLP